MQDTDTYDYHYVDQERRTHHFRLDPEILRYTVEDPEGRSILRDLSIPLVSLDPENWYVEKRPFVLKSDGIREGFTCAIVLILVIWILVTTADPENHGGRFLVLCWLIVILSCVHFSGRIPSITKEVRIPYREPGHSEWTSIHILNDFESDYLMDEFDEFARMLYIFTCTARGASLGAMTPCSQSQDEDDDEEQPVT